MSRQAGSAPTELRCVKRRHLHHREMNFAPLMKQFGPQRVGKSRNRMLSSTVRRLKRDRSISQCGTYLHDGAAIAWQHAFERRHRAINEAQVSDLGCAFVFLRRDFGEGGENGRHRVVDPHVDRPEFALHRVRRILYLLRIRHVGRNGEGLTTGGFHFPLCGFKAFLSTRKQTQANIGARECTHGGSAHARGCSGNDDYFPVINIFHKGSSDFHAPRRIVS